MSTHPAPTSLPKSTNPVDTSTAPQFLMAAIDKEDFSEDQLAELLLSDAVIAQASDVHIDPFRDRATIRFRIHGSLCQAAVIPPDVAQKVINQLKVRGKLHPMPTVLPGESRFGMNHADQHVDVRITTIQCHHGEKLHIRLLPSENDNYTLSELGLQEDQLGDLESWLKAPKGLVFVTGPTGAGKTTTLHAIARELVAANKNVLTIEEPIEYELDGATQIQVDDTSGLTFSAGIRAALRLDPDAILIGELRDPESVFAAITAAASGHTVITALHSRNAIDAVTVLRRWGAKNGPLASQLEIVINQRLLPILCQSCRYERIPNEDEITWFESHGVETPQQIADTTGCEKCNQNGSRGRVSVFELWKLHDKDRETLAAGQPIDQLINRLNERQHRTIEHHVAIRLENGDVQVPLNQS